MLFLLPLTAALTIAGTFTTLLNDTNIYNISAIAVDQASNTYITGTRKPAGSPVTASGDVFVSKLDSSGAPVFTRDLSGKGYVSSNAIALDPAGNVYIAGDAIPNQGFIVKLTNDGSAILYSTYFGGNLGLTRISGIAADPSGNLHISGSTTSPDFPHTAGMPFGPTPLGTLITGAILSCISPSGDKIIYSGILTGSVFPVTGGSIESTSSVGVAVDANGNAYYAGNAPLIAQ